MSDQSPNLAESTQKTVPSFADFFVYYAWRSSDEKKDKSFVGIKIEDNRPKIYFPMGYRASKPSEDVCKRDFYQLIAVLNDKSLQSYFSEEDLKKSQLDFPFYAYLSVLQYYLDFGYFVESETIYKKGFSGKISWPRTIKRIKPQVVKDEEGRHQVVYLNLITRKMSYREDNLITLVHKFCVKESARLIGLLYGVSENEVEEPELIFDYELFAEVIQDKIAATFNDKHLELFHAMLKMVRYLGNRDNHGEDGSENEPLFGVNTFAPVWEAMVDKIFGTVSIDEKRTNYNPSLKLVAENNQTSEGDDYQEEVGRNAEYKRSTLRPDTIMIRGQDTFVLDSKYYKYGLTGFNSHLPGAESVCKQMAYAEYVETRLKEIPAFAGMTSHGIYNAFIMPYCADAGKWDETNAKFSEKFGETGSLKMCRVGYIYGDWKNVKDENRPYHKIHCILLDMKSVMRNYANNPAAQSELAGVIGD